MSIQIENVLATAVRREASDLHLRVGKPPILRINGVLTPLDTTVLDGKAVVEAVKLIAADNARAQSDILERGGADFAIEARADDRRVRFRVNAFREQGNYAAVLHRLPSRILTPAEIGLPARVPELCRRPRGLFTVTGPTGSGKTTTLASLVADIARAKPQHILTVEEPTEYRLEHTASGSIITQREVPTDVATFADGLRQGLRQDPNMIVVGEMRDLETMEVAIRAAETGHLVLATLHTTSAARTVDRMVESFSEGKQPEIRAILSASLIGVLCQQLLLRRDGKGRVAAFEFLVVTPGVGNLIRERRTAGINDQIQTGKGLGMRLLDDHLYELVSAGTVLADEAVTKANDPERLRERLNSRRV